ncbi:MAG: DnaJ domain-containing protein [Rectinemataceae bacterium]|nr:DnaJ domain-containing protein [Rectinemataceae bacterium]
MATDLYKEIGVSRNASKGDVKRAYRKRAKSVHPDHSGDPDKFIRATHAYKILIDDEKRKRYDAGEDPEKLNSTRSSETVALSVLIELFIQAVEQADVDHINILGLVRKNLQGKMRTLENETAKGDVKIKRLESTMKRVKHKSGHENLLSKSLLTMINQIKDCQIKINEDVKITNIALKILDDYEYRVASIPIFTILGGTGGTTQTSF